MPYNFDCSVSTKTASKLSTLTSKGKAKRVVLISNSQNIYENLALEEWLYENGELTDRDYLLMWRNTPAVVIGRHQNPWLECDVQRATQGGVAVVRRNSGGGAVYHDEGNLNLSFLMHRSRYDRRRNLTLVVEAVTSHWDLDLDLNCRDDLVLDGVYKVSGTASKLGRDGSYHHFTLVFSVNRDVLSSLLHSPLMGVESRATQSVPSPVKNLTEDAPDMTFDTLVKVIGQRFLQDDDRKEVSVVDPTDESTFPGVTAAQRRLVSWDWIFGKTPPFTITRTFVKTLQESSGTSSFQESSGTRSLQESSGTHSLQESSGTHSLQESSGTHSLQESSGTRALQESSGTHSLQESSGTHSLQESSGTHSQFSLSSGTHSLQESSGTHSQFSLSSGTHSLQESSGTHSQFSLRTVVVVEKGRLQNVSLNLSVKSPGSGESVDLPFRLLDLVDVAGERLEGESLGRVWERCWERVGEEEVEEDYGLLRWGLECVIKCVPVGYVAG
ncbi:hypothetical protein ACOMHN_052514 [Nucella lapillus]